MIKSRKISNSTRNNLSSEKSNTCNHKLKFMKKIPHNHNQRISYLH